MLEQLQQWPANWDLQISFAGPIAKHRCPKLDPNSSEKLYLSLYFVCGPHETHSICPTLLRCASTRPPSRTSARAAAVSAFATLPVQPSSSWPEASAPSSASCSSSASGGLLLQRWCPRHAPMTSMDDGPVPVLGPFLDDDRHVGGPSQPPHTSAAASPLPRFLFWEDKNKFI
jgi:hypothetical protein